MSTSAARQNYAQLHKYECAALAKVESVDLYLRAYFLAVSRAKPNRHASFTRYELGRLLNKCGKPARKREIYAAIEKCVESKLLDKESNSACLVLRRYLTTIYSSNELLQNAPCMTHTGAQPEPMRYAICHPTQPHKAHELCEACYVAERRAAKAAGRSPYWE